MKEEINYRTVCFNAMEVMKRAAAHIREAHENRGDLKIEVKGEHNFVTEVDKEAEKMLVTGLSNSFPQAGFFTCTSRRPDPLRHGCI